MDLHAEGFVRSNNSGSANQRFESSLPSQSLPVPVFNSIRDYSSFSELWKSRVTITRSTDDQRWFWQVI
jgi:hypothetical protein